MFLCAKEAALAGAKLLCFPESFSYVGAKDGDSVKIAEPLDGPIMQRYCSLARWETTAPSLSLLKLYTLFQSELFWLLFSVHSANIYTYIFFSWGLLRNSSFLKWYRSCQSCFFLFLLSFFSRKQWAFEWFYWSCNWLM